jgi:hypothetical protein
MSALASDELLGGLPVGVVEHSRARTITDGEFGLLTSLTWTIGPMHVDDADREPAEQLVRCQGRHGSSRLAGLGPALVQD